MIPFNSPPIVGTERRYLDAALAGGGLSGSGGSFGLRCQEWLERALGSHRALLTPSCTSALELAALLLDVGPGDEVIMPSYTFVSTATAFALRGARVVFVDVRPDTMVLDETLVEAAVTERTKVVVAVHYAGVACDLEVLARVAGRHDLWVVEDAAQGLLATQRGRPLGAVGHLGCLSFHETKGFTAGGEGGALLVNDPSFADRAEVLREKGTDRARFQRGEVSRYSWQDLGSSALMSELQAAFLLAQFEAADRISARRHELWDAYREALGPVAEDGAFALPTIPAHSGHNAHAFTLKLPGPAERARFLADLAASGVLATFHFVPLHSSPAGRRFGRFHGVDRHTTDVSERVARLPLFLAMTDAQHRAVVDAVLRHHDRKGRHQP
ncbi:MULTISPECIES: dTDP-4-amino-4,6-dideoxygalactose transaminase [Actinosynnema]|uniref:dTDP-4-amino-4,6-dideoxygalactose transaminase n=1 Tax=Actinosynnema TaxID=40566 RepID=UPI0020A49BE1|nr:dTDP-4-amino-4,6-dideoxygalactose transaminase [Actinosynnema pretiosum]MCP2098816.1 dTDP-4-amino-4,6-dideoxygalactose transaminase [Actinosynnema pretiosum]